LNAGTGSYNLITIRRDHCRQTQSKGVEWILLSDFECNAAVLSITDICKVKHSKFKQWKNSFKNCFKEYNSAGRS